MLAKKNAGHVEMIIGPMFSGKTTELLRIIRRYEIARQNCLLIKHGVDVRYSACDISTHDKIQREAVSCTSLLGLGEEIFEDMTVIGIDEGQFFEDLSEFCEQMSDKGRIVVVSALSGTFERKLFKSVEEMLPHVDVLTHLTAVCMDCGKDAPFTKRTSVCKSIVEIGGKDKYKAVCRHCWLKK